MMSRQVASLRFQPRPSLEAPLRMVNLVKRGKEAGTNPRDIQDAIQEGLELGFLLDRGPGFAPSAVAETIITYDHRLQASR